MCNWLYVRKSLTKSTAILVSKLFLEPGPMTISIFYYPISRTTVINWLQFISTVCEPMRPWIKYLCRHQSMCLFLFKIDLQKYLVVIFCLSADPPLSAIFLGSKHNVDSDWGDFGAKPWVRAKSNFKKFRLVKSLKTDYSIIFITTSHPTSNVKTVKEQTFHKRSDIWQERNQNICVCSRIYTIDRLVHFYLVQERRFWTKSKQSVLNKTNSGILVSFPKQYWNVCPFVFKITTHWAELDWICHVFAHICKQRWTAKPPNCLLVNVSSNAFQLFYNAFVIYIVI